MAVWFVLSLFLVAYSDDGENTLILHSNVNVLETHTTFLKILEDHGHNVSILSTSDEKAYKFLSSYSNLVIFAGKDSSIDVLQVTKFMDDGGNALIIADTYSGLNIRKLISQVGFKLISPGSYVSSPIKTLVDRFTISVDVSESLLISNGMFHTVPHQTPLLYKGSALTYDSHNKYITNVLASSQYEVLYNKDKKTYNPAIINGLPTSLIGAVEMNNKKRVLVVPSVEFFSDQFLSVVYTYIEGMNQYLKTSNKLLIEQLLEWNFNKIGMLRISNVEHYLVRTGKPLKQYTVMEEIVYKLKIEIKSFNGWVPFLSDNVFFELNRINTHIRIKYNYTDDGQYSVKFNIPDFIGIYKCFTLFDKPGFSVLNHFEQIVVRPRKHNEFQRYVIKFWPYYFTSFLMMGLTYTMLYAVLNIKVKAE